MDFVLPVPKKSLYEVCDHYPTLWIEAVNRDDDHVHLQIEIPSNTTVSDAVGKLKAYSSKALQAKFKYIREMYLDKDGIWSVGFFSSTVGLNEEQMR
jgi:putative transposase